MARMRLITEGVLTAFADLVYANRERVYRVWLISPWVGAVDDGSDSLLRLIDGLRGTRRQVTVVTRPPQQAWHLRSIELLRANVHATLYGCASLHTKLYLLECNGLRAGILGSPNLTPHADRRNRELAIELRTTVESRDEPVAALLSDLTEYALNLCGEDDVSPL